MSTSADSHPIRNSVVASLIVASVTGIGSWFLGLWPTIWTWLGWCFPWLWSGLTSSVPMPLWLVVLISILALPSLFLFVAAFRKTAEPTPYDYVKDTFFGLTWRWKYNSRHEPVSVWCFCPFDDTALVPHTEPFVIDVLFVCETCGHRRELQGDMPDLISKATRQIARKIRSGEWRDVVEKQLQADSNDGNS